MLDRRAVLLGAAGCLFAARPARAGTPDALHRLGERLRRLGGDGLDPAWYPIPPAAAAVGDAEAYREGLWRAAQLALRDLLHGRADPPPERVDVRRDRSAQPLAPWLARLSEAEEPAAVIDAAADATPGAALLRRALAEAEGRAAQPQPPPIPPGRTIEPGSRDAERVPLLRARLAATDRSLAAARSEDPALYDASLQAAVRRFQQAAGLEVDGRVGPATLAALNRRPQEIALSLRVALDMARAAAAPAEERRIEVNIPDFMLHVREGERLLLEMPVIVGRPERATPLLVTRLTSVQFNPPWGVPLRNAIEDKLPQLQRNPLALQRQGVRIFQRVGAELVEVDPTTVDWRSYHRHRFPFVLRQDPGERNALGRIKFNMPNSEDIFMHDTPERHLFARGERAFSSGCIRLSEPMRFLALAMEGMPGWDAERMERSVREGRTFTVPLRRQLPVRLIYRTVVTEGGQLRVRPDIYGHDRAWWEAMVRGPARTVAARG
ncbi:MAG: L,D-transpeptidase family protein [Rhodovarius sp.]|nr:L,D-transpeptidase family protein [Rhodovarius sp.]MDW8315708.1 L,D-transpeptidase family protein [Rhodovarius sp.]